MRRIIVVLLSVVLIAGIRPRHHNLFAQTIAEAPPVVSPTYIAIPPHQQEFVSVAPSPQHVWIPGQWERTPGSWKWRPGRWVKPPFRNAYWVPGYWQHRSGHFVWQPAHWGAAKRGVIVAKPVAVPPLYVEPRPPVPAGSTGLVWQPGYWEWRGTWVWVPGEYIQSTNPQAVWVPGEWVAGTEGLWRWSPAHWAIT